MIQAMIFDLDGTLLNSEYLKAISYGRALEDLTEGRISTSEGEEAFKNVVGRSRKEVCQFMINCFALDTLAKTRGAEFGVDEDWQVLAAVRGAIYEEILNSPGTIRDNQWPYNIELLEEAKRASCKVGLATMSSRDTANFVLDALGVRDSFDSTMTVDEIEHTKPHPEIYLKVAEELGVHPTKCLVIEDSPAGVKSGVAAGMHVIAVATPFTHDALLAMQGFDRRWLVEDPLKLPSVINDLLTYLGQHGNTPAGWCKYKKFPAAAAERVTHAAEVLT